MKRLFWFGVGAVATVVVLRKVRGLIDEHTPPGVAQAAGVVSGLGGALRTARSEFAAGLAEREAELRHDLLGDVDLDEARTRADAGRSGRHPKRAPSRPGRHTDPGEIAQDPSDGELGYSFY